MAPVRDRQTTPVDDDQQGRSAAQSPRRINVAVTPDMLVAIERVVEREQVSLTEAVRRLIMYGDFVYRAVKEDRSAVILRAPDDGPEREVILM